MPATQLVDVDGRRLRLTNLDKVLYPETGTTKGDVIHYYAAIAPPRTRRLASAKASAATVGDRQPVVTTR